MLINKFTKLPYIFVAGVTVTLGGCLVQKNIQESSVYPTQQIPQEIVASEQVNLTTNVAISEQPQIELKPEPVDDVWMRIKDRFQFDLTTEHKSVIQHRNWYAKHPGYFKRLSERASRYLYHVTVALEEQNMPSEIALLPVVESAYDPFAYSHGRASGMWQFIPATGKRFGLEQNWWYDGRRDVVRSTEAAIKYLQYLHRRFDDDWLLALAAYNCGEGNVRKAIRKNRKQGKATDFWSLDLPEETRSYVPKLIAFAQLLNESEQYNLTFPEIANKPYFVTVDIGSQIDLAQAADLAGIELEELYRLNPGFNQWATSPSGPHQLSVPVNRADQLKQNLAQLPPEKRINWIRYTIKSGDSLSSIAAHYKTTTKVLREINGLTTNSIRAGKPLFVPLASKGAEQYVLSAAERLKSKQNRASLSNRIKQIHITQAGDSFWKIARKYNVGMRDVARWNNLGTTDVLREGQKLVIWSKASKGANGTELIRKVGYRVRSGDSLALIAQKFNIKISDIESWNGINRKKYLQPGQSLKLYVDVTRASL